MKKRLIGELEGMAKELSRSEGEEQIRDAFMRKFGPSDAPMA